MHSETRSTETITAEIEKLTDSLRNEDTREAMREERLGSVERELEELLIRESLGESVAREMARLRKAYAEAKLEPDRRRALRAAISQRNAELQRARRKEAEMDAARLASESLDRVAKLEAELFRVARQLGNEMRTLNQVYSRGIAGKLVGPTNTPRSLVFAAVQQAFGEVLHPVMERSPVKGDYRPLRQFLARLAARGTDEPASQREEASK